MTIHGRCFCGRVEIALEPPTDFVAYCHCRSCRLSHGAPMVAWTSVPCDRCAITGEENVKWFRSSETIEWGFCGECGSSLLYRAIAEGHHEKPKVDRMYVAVGCIEGELDRPPGVHVSFEERAPWHAVADDLPKYRGKGVERIG